MSYWFGGVFNIFVAFLVWLCHYLTDNKVVTGRIGALRQRSYTKQLMLVYQIGVLIAKCYSFIKNKRFFKLEFTGQNPPFLIKNAFTAHNHLRGNRSPSVKVTTAS